MMKQKNLYVMCMLTVSASVWASDAPIFKPTNEPETRFDISPEVKLNERPQPSKPIEANPNNKTLELSSEELLKQPQLLHRALSSAVLLKNIEGLKILLPLYLRLPEAERQDKLALALAQAMLARAEGKAAKAVQHYQEALAIDEHLPSVRLELAQALFENHQNRDAEKLFKEIQQEKDLPPQITVLTDEYLKAIDKRLEWNVHAGANYTRDNNINNTPKQRVFERGRGRIELPESESAQGIAYRASAEKDWQLPKNYRVRAGVNLDGKYYWDNIEYNDLNIRAYAGGVYRSARAEAAVLPYYERRWYGGSRYSTEKGVRVEQSYWLTPKHQLMFGGEVGYEHYDRRKFLNGQTANASGTWLWVQSPRQYFTFGLDLARKKARDESDAYHRKGIRASWSRDWGKGFQTMLSASVGQREYDAADFFNIVRKDKEYQTTVSIWNRNLKLWGFTPRLVGIYQKNCSNHFMYNYHKAFGFIQVSKSI